MREREGRKAYSREKGRENESKKKVGDAVKVFSSACKCMEEERGACVRVSVCEGRELLFSIYGGTEPK